MAIIFVSPKTKEKMFIKIAVTLLVLVLVTLFLIILPFKPSTSIVPVSNKTPLKIDFNVVDSPQFKNLEVFSDAKIEFSYIAKDKNGQQVTGNFFAKDRDDAKMILEGMGFKISSLEEKNIGRAQPFAPYY